MEPVRFIGIAAINPTKFNRAIHSFVMKDTWQLNQTLWHSASGNATQFAILRTTP